MQVVAVDMAVYPPSYGVQIGDNIRETEASRLTSRALPTSTPRSPHRPAALSNGYACSSPPPSSQQEGFSPHSHSNGSFDSFQSASSGQLYQPQHHNHQQSLSNLGQASDARRHPQAFSSNRPGDSGFSPTPNAASLDWFSSSNQNSGPAAAPSHYLHQMDPNSQVSSVRGGPVVGSGLPRLPSSSSHTASTSVGYSNPPTGWHVPSKPQGHNHAADDDGDEEDDGFGDFAEAPPSPHRTAAAAQEPALNRHASDSWISA